MPRVPLEPALRNRVLLFNAGVYDRRLPWTPDVNVTHGAAVLAFQRELIEAGSDGVETFTSHADPIAVAREQQASAAESDLWNRAAAAIGRLAAGEERYVLGVLGPGSMPLSLTPDERIEEHIASYAAQARSLWLAGVDAIHAIFVSDSRTLKAILLGVETVQQESGRRIPVLISFDVETAGTLISGERSEDVWPLIQPHRPIGLALATYGRWQESLRRLGEVSGLPVGLFVDPFRHLEAEDKPIEWVEQHLAPLLAEGLLRFCGISCTLPSMDYVRAAARLISSHRSLT